VALNTITLNSDVNNSTVIWPSGFKEEDLKKFGQSETRTACGGHVC